MLKDFFFFFLLVHFFSLLDGSCLFFHPELAQNHCSSSYTHTEDKRLCFRCYINMISTQFNAIRLNESCSPIPNNHCVDLRFNTTELFREFSRQYANLTNQLFAPENTKFSATTNSLYVHITYDTHRSFSFDSLQSLDLIENRTYNAIGFTLDNRQDQITLPLNDDIQNMTLEILQINIYCGSRGLYQYNYRADNHNQSLLKSLTCELPTTTISSRKAINTSTSTEKIRSQLILLYSLIGSGSLIPCLILICCLYILCKRKEIERLTNIGQRDSFVSSIRSESVSSSDQHMTFQ